MPANADTSSYATITDLQTYGVSQLALQTVPAAAQQTALNAMSNHVDGYLGSRFTLPLKQWGADITRAVCILAAYDLLFVRGYNPADGADVELKNRHDDIVEWLNKIADGKVVPVVQDSSPIAAADRGGGGAFTRQVQVQQTNTENQGVQLTLGGVPGQLSDNGQGGIVFVGPPTLRGWW